MLPHDGIGGCTPSPRKLRNDSRMIIWATWRDRKSTRLNSSHANISYAVFCLKKKNSHERRPLSARPDLLCHVRAEQLFHPRPTSEDHTSKLHSLQFVVILFLLEQDKMLHNKV